MSVSSRAVPARRVGRLRIRGTADGVVRHAAVLLSDALSTASLPGADEQRLVVIRRLPLGRISLPASSPSLALLIERTSRDVLSAAVGYDAPSAAAANAVAFRDRGEAIVALARRLATDRPADEWFWPKVIEGWRADAPRGERWTQLIESAHGGSDAAALAAAVVEEAVRVQAQDSLLASLVPGQGARWLRSEGWTDVSPDAAARPWRPLRSRHAEVVHRWSRQWGAADDRSIWLATMASVIERPACTGDPQLPGRIAFAMMRDAEIRATNRAAAAPELSEGEAAGHGCVRLEGAGRGLDALTRLTAAAPDASSPVDALAASAPANASAEHAAIVAGETPEDRSRESVGAAGPVQPAPAHDHSRAGVFTFFAGLCFVVPMLERLDFAAFLAAHPAFLDEAFPARLLRHIGRRAGLPSTDPLAIALDALVGDRSDAIVEHFRDWRLPDRCREMLATPRPPMPIESPFTAWTAAVRRWCRRHARMGLATLVGRPGLVRLSRTHLDASFALSQLDVRVRRVALDVDPGWVPWLGRVVHFTYEDHGS